MKKASELRTITTEVKSREEDKLNFWGNEILPKIFESEFRKQINEKKLMERILFNMSIGLEKTIISIDNYIYSEFGFSYWKAVKEYCYKYRIFNFYFGRIRLKEISLDDLLFDLGYSWKRPIQINIADTEAMKTFMAEMENLEYTCTLNNEGGIKYKLTIYHGI